MEESAKPLIEINREAIRILVRELGPSDAARFVRQFTVGLGDYTEEHKNLFKDLSVDEIAERIRQER